MSENNNKNNMFSFSVNTTKKQSEKKPVFEYNIPSNIKPTVATPNSNQDKANATEFNDELKKRAQSDIILQEYLNKNPKVGFLQLQTLSGRSLIPISDSNITVFKIIDGNKYIFGTDVTDESGKTHPMSLPAPSAELSQTPGNIKPFAAYDVRIEHQKYMPVTNLNVPIFENIVSIQPVQLSPQLSGDTTKEETNIEEEPKDL